MGYQQTGRGQHHNALKGTVTAILGIAIALPFTLLHPIFPFIVVLLGLGFLLLLQRWRWIQRPQTACLKGHFVALIALIPLSGIVTFTEQGMQDGPFYGQRYGGSLDVENASHRLPYRQGELLIYNRQDDEAPILTYQIEDDVRWATVLNVQKRGRYADYQIAAMKDPELAYGILRDRLNFRATWNFGEEHGRAYLWKAGRLHRFFLSR